MDEAKTLAGFVPKLSSRNAVFRNFDLAYPTKGKEQLDDKFRWVFRSLADDVSHRSRHGSMEQDASRLKSGKIDAHRLSWLEGSHNSPLTKLCAESAANANAHGIPHGPRVKLREWVALLPGGIREYLLNDRQRRYMIWLEVFVHQKALPILGHVVGKQIRR
jgi:hypothetical protein